MEDSRIVDLYWQRDEQAIRHTDDRYGGYLLTVANHILADEEDSHECVNDTYMKAWNSMPTHRPQVLRTYLAKITRQVSIDRYRHRGAQKRFGSEYALSLEELTECVGGQDGPQQELELQALVEALGRYLRQLEEPARLAFIWRYFYLDPLREIAARQDSTVSQVKSMLHRTRLGLRAYLTEEGFDL